MYCTYCKINVQNILSHEKSINHKYLSKGSKCWENGHNYEETVYNIIQSLTYMKCKFVSQELKQVGKSSRYGDIICLNSIGIEVKKYNSPDWGQCTLLLDNNNTWIANGKNLNVETKHIFESLIPQNIFDNRIPPFMNKKITYNEWLSLKSNFKDQYFDCENDTIEKIYRSKQCSYIQISKYGLFHLGNDILQFNVPRFICPQKLRIRVKVHERNTNGYASLSVTLSCKPINTKFTTSPFSLDNPLQLPMCFN